MSEEKHGYGTNCNYYPWIEQFDRVEGISKDYMNNFLDYYLNTFKEDIVHLYVRKEGYGCMAFLKTIEKLKDDGMISSDKYDIFKQELKDRLLEVHERQGKIMEILDSELERRGSDGRNGNIRSM